MEEEHASLTLKYAESAETEGAVTEHVSEPSVSATGLLVHIRLGGVISTAETSV